MSDLRPVHVDTHLDPGNSSKWIAGILVALVIVAMGAFGWHAGFFTSHEAVPDQNLPQASMPVVPPAKG